VVHLLGAQPRQILRQNASNFAELIQAGAAGPAPPPQWKITVENIGGAFACIPSSPSSTSAERRV
jgi:hypothetical protein